MEEKHFFKRIVTAAVIALLLTRLAQQTASPRPSSTAVQ